MPKIKDTGVGDNTVTYSCCFLVVTTVVRAMLRRSALLQSSEPSVYDILTRTIELTLAISLPVPVETEKEPVCICRDAFPWSLRVLPSGDSDLTIQQLVGAENHKCSLHLLKVSADRVDAGSEC